MSKHEIEKSSGRPPATVGLEVSGLSSGILAAAEDLETNKLRLQQAKHQPSFSTAEEEDPGFLESLLYLALSPVLLPLGLGVLAYEKIWRPIADHVNTSKQLKLESERKLAELVETPLPILVDGKIRNHAQNPNGSNPDDNVIRQAPHLGHSPFYDPFGEWMRMRQEYDRDAGKDTKALLDDAQTLVDRATRFLKNKTGHKALSDKEEDDVASLPYICFDLFDSGGGERGNVAEEEDRVFVEMGDVTELEGVDALGGISRTDRSRRVDRSGERVGFSPDPEGSLVAVDEQDRLVVEYLDL